MTRLVGCALGVLLGPSVALAQPVAPTRSRVLLITEGASPALASAAARLESELEAAGFSVTLLAHAGDVDPRSDAETTGSRDDGGPAPFATIALAPIAGTANADVWVVDRITQKTVVRRVASESDADAVAIHASELLRASLLEIAVDRDVLIPPDVAAWLGPLPFLASPVAAAGPPSAPASPGPTPPLATAPLASAPLPVAPSPPNVVGPPYAWVVEGQSPPRPPSPSSRRGGFMIGASAAVLLSYRGYSPAIGPAADLRYRFDGPLHVELDTRVAAPIGSSDIVDPAGASIGRGALKHGLADVSLLFRAFEDEALVRPSIGFGVGGTLLDAAGKGSTGHPAHHVDAFAFTTAVTSDVELRFTSVVRGFIGLSTIFSLPETVVEIAGTDAAQAGEPLFLPWAGVAFAL